MKNHLNFKASLLVAALLALPLAQAATMNKADYNTEKTRLSATYKADKAACAALTDNARDICKAEAKGKDKVMRAELEHGYSGKVGDQAKVQKAKAEAAYDVAKEKCDDQSGNAKDVCDKEAKAMKTKAMSDTETAKDVRDAKKDGAQDKMDANYKVAIEKCDALASTAKDTCVAAARNKFNKN